MSTETPFILVGTKTDLRDDPDVIKKLAEKNKEPITTKMGKKRAKEIKAKAYLECTAKDLPTVNEVFRSAIKIVMDPLKVTLVLFFFLNSSKGVQKESRKAC